MELNEILDLLEKEFNRMSKVFPTNDWKTFKFGLGGPYKNEMKKFQKMSMDYDRILLNHFKIKEETASFGNLIVLCLRNDSTYKEMYKYVSIFRRQIKRMRSRL